ncbi:hypothetical protein TIFTF001_041970 [Ficus carica]|uniref:Glycosyltransferase n=1 Tax=Ficus carica TaxID=3494 RepID=A0AA87ZHP7_FICCA|nr:hypothetical protein TIFTF001_041970 [Ficus carica]
METTPIIHVLLVSYPANGHINPLLRLGKRLVSKGLQVTLSTTQNFSKHFPKPNDTAGGETTPSVGFEFFDDGLTDGDTRRDDLDFYVPQLDRAGRESLPRLIKALNDDKGRPVSCIVNNPFIPWKTVPFPTYSEPEIEVQLPRMPVLKHDEIPSFLHTSSPYKVLARAILEQLEKLPKLFCLLADTFDELERDIIDDVSRFSQFTPVGPLFRGRQKDGHVERADECIKWLESKPPSSVVYISFGTVVYLKQEQVEEIAHGVLKSGVSFLWVIRSPPKKDSGQKPVVLPNGFLERIGDRGKVVEWSPQVQVLAHPSVTCFLTHCGWNSTVEAMASDCVVGRLRIGWFRGMRWRGVGGSDGRREGGGDEEERVEVEEGGGGGGGGGWFV